jgi:FeS assembly SUF system protein
MENQFPTNLPPIEPSNQPVNGNSAAPQTITPLWAQPIEGPKSELRQKVIGALKTVYDPEIPVNIYELGLIYEILIDEADFVTVRMTLTAPNCPAANSLPIDAETKINALEGVSGCKVELVWEPSWNKDMMSEVAKLELGFM